MCLRRLVIGVAAFLALAGAARSQQMTTSVRMRFQGGWRLLAHRLPGAYRFIDRLNLTEEQKKALAKISMDWAAERRELLTEVARTLPNLTKEERKNPEKVKAHYAKRREIYQSAQVPAPLALVSDVLTDDQIARIVQAGKVLDSWRKWLADHLEKCEARLDKVLGPDDAETASGQKLGRLFVRQVPGGELLGRLDLSNAQVEKLEAIRKNYYADYSDKLGALNRSLQGGSGLAAHQVSTVRRTIGSRLRSTGEKKNHELIRQALTKEQRERLDKAIDITRERDDALWKRYQQYLQELSAVFAAAEEPQQNTTAESRPEHKARER
jgi:Spy/CpxP family protein refolding chaperone